MSEPLPTKERLAQAIEARLGKEYNPLVTRIIMRARLGVYDEFESDIASPISQLVHDLRAVGFDDMAQRAIEGDFDCTEEEGQAWMQREGYPLLLGKKGKEGQ